MPGSKQTEVGILPDEWDVVTLDGAAGIIDPQPDHRTPPECAGGDPYIGISDFLDDRTVDWDGSRKIVPTAVDKQRDRFQVRNGDIIFGKIGTIGRPKFVPDPSTRYGLSANVLLLQPRGAPYFLMAWLRSDAFQRAVNAELHSTSQAAFGINKMRRMLIAAPPEPEQRAIAAALSDVDALLGALDRLIAKKRDLKQAAMQQLLTGQTRLPGFSGKWETKRLGEFARIRNDKVLPKQVDPGTACVELEHVGQGDGRLHSCATANDSTSSKYRFRIGDVLFGRLRPYLRKYWLADRDGICTTEIWPLTVDGQVAFNGFLHAVVQTPQFVDAASISYGTHMPRADWGIVKNFAVRLPPADEQQAVAAVLADMDAELSALEQRRDKTRLLKQGMMQELLTGRTRLV